MGRWVSTPGVIYPLPSFMDGRGPVEGKREDETRRSRRFYRITTHGSEKLARLKDVMKPRLMEAQENLRTLSNERYAARA